MKKPHFIFSPEKEDIAKGDPLAANGNKDKEQDDASSSTSEEDSLADRSLSTGDLDGGGGQGSGLTGGDDDADSGDIGPTPDKQPD